MSGENNEDDESFDEIMKDENVAHMKNNTETGSKERNAKLAEGYKKEQQQKDEEKKKQDQKNHEVQNKEEKNKKQNIFDKLFGKKRNEGDENGNDGAGSSAIN